MTQRTELRELHSGVPVPQTMTPHIQTNLRCTVVSCVCANFNPCFPNQRECSVCGHGWIPHAVDKLYHGISDLVLAPQPINVDIVFDVASLILYGAQGIPIRLKILLDKLFARLQHNEVLQVIYSLSWTYEDYVRGYKYKEGSQTLASWIIPGQEEERSVLQHFTKFPDTRDAATQFIYILENTAKTQSTAVESSNAYHSKLRDIILSMPTTNNPVLLAPPVTSSVPAADHRSQILGRTISVSNPVVIGPFTKTQVVNPVPKITSPAFTKVQSGNEMSDCSPPSQNQGFSLEQDHSERSRRSTLSTSRLSLYQNKQRHHYKHNIASSTHTHYCFSCRRNFKSSLMYKLHRNLHHGPNSANNTQNMRRNFAAAVSKTIPSPLSSLSKTSYSDSMVVTSSSKEVMEGQSALQDHFYKVEPQHESASDLESLQSLVAHLDTPLVPKSKKPSPSPGSSTSRSSCSNKYDDNSVYPPNASIEIGPGGSMIPTLKQSKNNSPAAVPPSTTSQSSQSKNDINSHRVTSSSLDFDMEVPILGETLDGLICGVCHKTYKNKTCLKQHFNNVHLRLQHHCWIKGCSSSFPSKRSRDRHSLNFNLHSHLLQAEGDVIDFSSSKSSSDQSYLHTSSGSPAESSDGSCQGNIDLMKTYPFSFPTSQSSSADLLCVAAAAVAADSEPSATVSSQNDIKMEDFSAAFTSISNTTTNAISSNVDPVFLDSTQSAVVWPKPAPLHDQLNF